MWIFICGDVMRQHNIFCLYVVTGVVRSAGSERRRWHTMVHVPLIFLSEWREFPSATCLAGKKNLMTARVSMLLKSCASLDMLLFSLCDKKSLEIRHMNRPLFPTTQSIPSYDIGKCRGKDLSAPPHIISGNWLPISWYVIPNRLRYMDTTNVMTKWRTTRYTSIRIGKLDVLPWCWCIRIYDMRVKPSPISPYLENKTVL
jgi:hypothetical protein